MSRKSALSTLLLGSACFVAAGASGGVAHAQDAGANNSNGEIVVTAQRRAESIQNVPIAVSAFSGNQLSSQGLNGGRDLVQSIPNASFNKGNFTGYNFQIRGVGAAVVATSADTGVGIHLNNAPLTANRLFEADYYDIERVEVLRGPQGTLYGRNATGGVVNVITRQPTHELTATLTGEYGNFDSTRLTGIVNVPLGDTLAVRVAATALDREGYGYNATLHRDIDGRNLWAGRVTIAWEPTDNIRTWLSYEHFDEDDNRVRSQSQACITDNGQTSVNGNAIVNPVLQGWFGQGCLPGSIYDSSARGAVNSLATLGGSFGAVMGMLPFNAYAGITNDSNLRNGSSAFNPEYQAGADVYEWNLTVDLSPQLTVSSIASYNEDHIRSFQDYNRLPTSLPFRQLGGGAPNASHTPILLVGSTMGWYTDGTFCDPQLGCDNHFRTFDVSSADSTQWSEELRLQSHFDGPLNFDVGAVYVNYEVEPSNYFVYSNTLSAAAYGAALCPANLDLTGGVGENTTGCNYYLNRSNYQLESWAVDGEVYYQFNDDLRFTIGARYTDDTKHVDDFSPILFAPTSTQPVVGQDAEFQEWTGRIGFDWHLHPGFTDSTLLYAFYSRGYKGGGFNPPASVGISGITATYDPEFVDAYEIGLKNQLFDGRMLLNLTGFYYDYQGYQISKIVNRSSVNENIDAVVQGIEFETVFQPFHGFRVNATAGYMNTEIQGGSSLDVFDRIQGNAGETLIHDPFTAENCVVSTAALTPAVVAALNAVPTRLGYACANAGYLAIAQGILTTQGHEVDLTGNELPNSPHWTANLGAQYQWGLGGDWTAMVRADYSYHGEQYARIYNSDADKLDSYDNLNLLFRLDNPGDGVTFEIYGQNIMDNTSVTATYLTDDSSGLFRNLFLTDPRTVGVRLSKQF